MIRTAFVALVISLSAMTANVSAQDSNLTARIDLEPPPTPVPAPATLALVGLGAVLLYKKRR